MDKKSYKIKSAKEVKKNHQKTYGQKTDYVDESLDKLFGKIGRKKRVS